MATQRPATTSGSISYGNRLKMRTVPMFPLRRAGRPLSSDAHTKPKICTSNQKYKPARSTLTIPQYKPVNYKQTVSSKLNTRSNIHYKPENKIHVIQTNDVKHFKSVKPKVDTTSPWSHRETHTLEELVEMEGFALNPRFGSVVKSHSFDSVHEILQYLGDDLDNHIQALVEDPTSDSINNDIKTSKEGDDSSDIQEINVQLTHNNNDFND